MKDELKLFFNSPLESRSIHQKKTMKDHRYEMRIVIFKKMKTSESDSCCSGPAEDAADASGRNDGAAVANGGVAASQRRRQRQRHHKVRSFNILY